MGISVTKLLILLAIIVVIFGTKRLRNIGTDLGDAIRNFRTAVKSDDESADEPVNTKAIDGELAEKAGEKAAEKTDTPV